MLRLTHFEFVISESKEGMTPLDFGGRETKFVMLFKLRYFRREVGPNR